MRISREGAMNPNRMYDNMRNTTITLEEAQQNISDLDIILEYLRIIIHMYLVKIYISL